MSAILSKVVVLEIAGAIIPDKFSSRGTQPMKLKHLVTIGYEGANFADFLATLNALGVTTLLDIRELPISRRRGFAKTALREGLASVGISYRHEPRLGSPKAIRHQLRDDGDLKQFFRSFDRYLSKQGDLLEQLATELTGTIALLCYERDHTTCHRNSVANALSALTGLKPKHHGVQGHAQRQAAADSRTNLGQGVPAT
jgi:uncharacterized protein (DUF488 family)